MNDEGTTTRRSVLLWGATSALAAPLLAIGAERASAPASGGASAAGAGGAAAPAASGTPLTVQALERYMRMHASTTDGASPWYYTGRIYAVREKQAPLLLFTFEGTEIYWVKRVANDAWTTKGSTLTFFRDLATGAYLDTWANPITGRTVDVKPNVLRTKPGGGSRIGTAANELMPGVALPWQVEVNTVDGITWLTTHRGLASMPQPWLEAQTMMAPEREIADPRVTSATTTFASTYLAPYLKWMDMGDAPGHLMWHAAGRKLRSRDDLPKPYRERAERVSPVHFTLPE